MSMPAPDPEEIPPAAAELVSSGRSLDADGDAAFDSGTGCRSRAGWLRVAWVRSRPSQLLPAGC